MNRSIVLFISGLVLAPLLPGLMGCAGDRPAALVSDGEPIGTQLLRAVPSLKDERFSTLLDFESQDDAIFCNTIDGGGGIATGNAHTGRAAFKIDPGAKTLFVKLNSLLAGRQFPGAWTLAGGFFYSEQATKIKVGFDPALGGAEPHEVDLPAGAWTAVFAELPDAAPQQSVPSLAFDLGSGHGTIWCDDVMLIDNYKLLVGSTQDASPTSEIAAVDVGAEIMPAWTIRRRGFNFIGLAPGQFDFKLLTSEAAPGGWIVDEANAMRARFHCLGSEPDAVRSLTVYADGRTYWGGQYKPMSDAARVPILKTQHEAPARIEVDEGMGRVDRNTPGDANNDGYNETTGSYRIIANGPRIELHFIPTNSSVLSPILEFSGLPFGKALITLEGRLVEQSTRTSSGTLLVELPAKIDRPVTVDVRIEE